MSWYSKWFGSDYISLYSHRDAAEATKQIQFLLSRLSPPVPLKVLDIACGFGRHVAEFEMQGHWAAGIDLSAELLSYSRRRMPALNLIRADMRRLPFARGSFDLLCSFFTSFGYFERDEEHRELLTSWAEVLRPGGRLFLDYLNKPEVIGALRPLSVNEDDAKRYEQHRWIDSEGRRVCKRIVVTDKASCTSSEYLESVRMYDRSELHSLLENAGFQIDEELGDFEGSTFHAASPRLLVLAHTARA